MSYGESMSVRLTRFRHGYVQGLPALVESKAGSHKGGLMDEGNGWSEVPVAPNQERKPRLRYAAKVVVGVVGQVFGRQVDLIFGLLPAYLQVE